MKIKITITRQALADKDYGKAQTEIMGEEQPLPDEAQRIAEAINKILLKEDI